jgi:hypothetical protein
MLYRNLVKSIFGLGCALILHTSISATDQNNGKQYRYFERNGIKWYECINEYGRTAGPCGEMKGQAGYYETEDDSSSVLGNMVYLRYNVMPIRLRRNGQSIHYLPQEFGFTHSAFLKTALECSIKPEDANTEKITLLNISDRPERELLLLSLLANKYVVTFGGRQKIDQIIRDRCQESGIAYDKLHALAQANAPSVPRGSMLVIADNFVFCISLKQYNWAHQLLEANKDVFLK